MNDLERIPVYKNKDLINEDFSSASLPPIREDFIAKLENSLMFLNYKDLSMWHSDAKNKVHLQNFDGAWLLDVSLRHKEKDDFTLKPFGDFQVTPDMFPNLNLRTLNLSGEVGHLSKYKFLDNKQKRNLENYKYIFSERSAFLDYGKQKWWTNENGYGFNKINNINNELNCILPMHTPLVKGAQYDKRAVARMIEAELKDPNSSYMHTLKGFHMALQLSLTYDYEWSCYIKETPDSLGVRIPIHPSSSKEVFMMRNIPEGKSRKKAIVNFVKDHYRTIKGCNDNERQVLIQKHLRGDLKFKWRGLEVHITPSPYDLRRTKTTKNFLKFED